MNVFKSKTILFSTALGMLGAAQLSLSAIQEVISPAIYGWLTLAIAVAVAGLRAVTTDALADK